MSRGYCIPHSDPSDDRFFDIFSEALVALGEKHGLEFAYGFYDEVAENLARHVYSEAEGRAMLSIVDDYETPVRYLMIESETQGEIDQIKSWLSELLHCIPLEQLQEDARARMTGDPSMLVRLALGAGEKADSKSLEILISGLRSKDGSVRIKALEAASLTQWPEFEEEFKTLSQSDPNPEVREMAETVRDILKQQM